MSDDRWRDSYDTWKLATPPEYEMTPEEEDRVYEEAREARADHCQQEVDAIEGLRERIAELEKVLRVVRTHMSPHQPNLLAMIDGALKHE